MKHCMLLFSTLRFLIFSIVLSTQKLAADFGKQLVAHITSELKFLDDEGGSDEMEFRLSCVLLCVKSLQGLKTRLKCKECAVEQYYYKVLCIAHKKKLVFFATVPQNEVN